MSIIADGRKGDRVLLMGNDALAGIIAREVAQEVKILPHHGHSKGYLQQLVEVHTRRSLLALIPTP